MNTAHTVAVSQGGASPSLSSSILASGRPSERSRRASRPLPQGLPAGVWHAEGLPLAEELTLSTGEAALDAVLPGGGWPVGALTELLQPQPHAHLWRLLAPGLVLALARQPGPVVLVSPPRAPFVPALAAQGLPADRWLRVDTSTAAARLWATEQALRCAEVAAVLAWLPQTEASDLRRLQLAAQRHRQLLFVMRPLSARDQASPARLRLMVDEAGTPPSLRVQVLKRRGPPLVSPLRLPAQPPLLARLLRSRRGAAWPLEVLAGTSLSAAPSGAFAQSLPESFPASFPASFHDASPESFPSRPPHGLDRAPTRA